MLMRKIMINHSRKKSFRLGIAYFQRNPLVEDDCLLSGPRPRWGSWILRIQMMNRALLTLAACGWCGKCMGCTGLPVTICENNYINNLFSSQDILHMRFPSLIFSRGKLVSHDKSCQSSWHLEDQKSFVDRPMSHFEAGLWVWSMLLVTQLWSSILRHPRNVAKWALVKPLTMTCAV